MVKMVNRKPLGKHREIFKPLIGKKESFDLTLE